MNYVDPITERRVGAYAVHYGWLFNTYNFVADLSGVYWQRFG